MRSVLSTFTLEIDLIGVNLKLHRRKYLQWTFCSTIIAEECSTEGKKIGDSTNENVMSLSLWRSTPLI